MKYRSYDAIIKAYSTGDLNSTDHILTVDNDDCFIMDLETEEILFRGNPNADFCALCDAAGIPNEHV